MRGLTPLTSPACFVRIHKALDTTITYNEEALFLTIDITVFYNMMFTYTIFIIVWKVILGEA